MPGKRLSVTFGSRALGGYAMGAARPLAGAARFAASAVGQAAVVPHVAEHDLGAAAYAIKAVRASVPRAESDVAGRAELIVRLRCLSARNPRP